MKNKETTTTVNVRYSNPFRWVYMLCCLATAMIGYNIHGNLFYSIVNFFLTPISWIWWLIGQDVNMTIIRDTFSFFFN